MTHHTNQHPVGPAIRPNRRIYNPLKQGGFPPIIAQAALCVILFISFAVLVMGWNQ